MHLVITMYMGLGLIEKVHLEVLVLFVAQLRKDLMQKYLFRLIGVI